MNLQFKVAAACLFGLAGCASADLKVTTELYTLDLDIPSSRLIEEVNSSAKTAHEARQKANQTKLRLEETYNDLKAFDETMESIATQFDASSQETAKFERKQAVISTISQQLPKLNALESNLASSACDVVNMTNRFRAVGEEYDWTKLVPYNCAYELTSDSLDLSRQHLTDLVYLHTNILNSELVEFNTTASRLASALSDYAKNLSERSGILSQEIAGRGEAVDCNTYRAGESVERFSNGRTYSLFDRRYKPVNCTELSEQIEAVRRIPTISIQKTEAFLDPKSARSNDIRSVALQRNFYNSQIDRLQDPADRALAMLITDENPKSWKVVNEAKFHARGRTSVVAVRDRLGQFALKSADNSPGVLIAGQLGISRTIADGALQIYAAASGVPLLETVPGSGGGGSQTSMDADGDAAVTGDPGNLEPALLGDSVNNEPSEPVAQDTSANSSGYIDYVGETRVVQTSRRLLQARITSFIDDAKDEDGDELSPELQARLISFLNSQKSKLE